MTLRLATPGPTPVPEAVAKALAAPLIYHRSDEFRQVFSRVNQNLRYLFQTAGPVLTLTSSGTGAMEAAFVNCFSPGESVITVNGGKFGERWVHMPRVFGIEVEEVRVPWGRAVSVPELREALRRRPEAKGVVLTHSETSSGTALDLRALSRIVRENSDALVIVDGVSSVGVLPLFFEAWGIDVCVTGSQKGLMVPPGLAFVALSKRAEAAVASSTMPRFYLDLRRAIRSLETNDTPWTPAIPLVVGLDVALGQIRDEGLEEVWARHRRVATIIREGLVRLGLKLFSSAPSDGVTAAWIPDGVPWKVWQSLLRERGRLIVSGGQGEYAGKIFRIGHMGYCSEEGAKAQIDGVRDALLASEGAKSTAF